MRKLGSVSEFSAERDAQLVENFRKRLREALVVDLDRIFAEVAKMRAPRFYVSEYRALLAIRYHKQKGRWDVKGASRVEMFEEIERRVDRIMVANPEMKMKDAVAQAIETPAPEFYLTPRSCRTLIYKAMQQPRR